MSPDFLEKEKKIIQRILASRAYHNHCYTPSTAGDPPSYDSYNNNNIIIIIKFQSQGRQASLNLTSEVITSLGLQIMPYPSPKTPTCKWSPQELQDGSLVA